MAVHGVARATGDLDVWIARDPENADRAYAALARFGAPLAASGVSRDDLLREDQVLQVGLPPDASTSSRRSAASRSTRPARVQAHEQRREVGRELERARRDVDVPVSLR